MSIKESKDRYIIIGSKEISVNENVYRAFKRPAWVERKRRARECRCFDENGNRCLKSCRECDAARAAQGLSPKERDGRSLSLDRLTENGYEVAQDGSDPAEIVAYKILLDELYAALDELAPDERSLIDALFFAERTERDYGDEIGMSHQAIGKRKRKAIDKLRSALGVTD
jgi:RNA polymerase sigma factor (sigma-70 family)